MSEQPIPHIDRPTNEFIESFGRLVSEAGLPPSIGRVMGLLIITDKDRLSAEEIQGALRLSAGSVSSALNLLIKLGYVIRVSVPGDRRHYYYFEADSWQHAIRVRLAQMERGIELANKGLRLRSGDPRLTAMQSMYVQIYDAIKGINLP